MCAGCTLCFGRQNVVAKIKYLIYKAINVVWSSKISRKSKILILRYSQIKDIISFVSYCFYNPSIAHIFGTKCPISVRFSAKCSFQNGAHNQVDLRNLNVNDFRLILLDHTTNRHAISTPCISILSKTGLCLNFASFQKNSCCCKFKKYKS